MKHMHLFCCTKNKSLKKSIINEISKDSKFFDAIFEIVNNIHLKNLDLSKLTQAQKKKMKAFEPLMRKIHRKPKSKLIRRKLVKQTGGWIGFVLPIVTSVVSELVSHAVSKKSNAGST